MTKMNNRVYGAIGIGVKNANFNASFDKTPKTLSNGTIFGSHQASKYPNRVFWDKLNEKVFYLKSYTEDGNVKKINERFQELFETEDKDIQVVKSNLFKCIDVMNYGAAYTGSVSVDIRGVVQVNNGENKYELTTVDIFNILSPFGNKNSEKDTKQSSLGETVVTDEAHYVYSINVNPFQYDKYIGNIEGFEGYAREAYDLFKEASLIAVSDYNSASKTGCQNEFAIFVELKDGVQGKFNLNELGQYIKVYNSENSNKRIYDLTILTEILNSENINKDIKSIEIYYNLYTLELLENIENAKRFNIITREEI